MVADHEHRIFLVRHGEAAASWGQSADPGLSTLGKDQARQAADRLIEVLRGETPALISSPLARAQETAAPLAERLSCPVSLDDRFREIPTPVALEQRQDWLRRFMREHWDSQHESLHQWRRSILDAVQALPANAIVFTHFLVINAVVGHCQRSEKTMVFWPDNASVTRLLVDEGELRIAQLGHEMETEVN